MEEHGAAKKTLPVGREKHMHQREQESKHSLRKEKRHPTERGKHRLQIWRTGGTPKKSLISLDHQQTKIKIQVEVTP